MRATIRLMAVATLAATVACSESSPTSPDSLISAEQSAGIGLTSPVTAMTRNLYVGADVDAVIRAIATPDPMDDFAALQSAIATLQATDFPARARAIAAEIAAARPDVVGLQEVFDLHVDLNAIGVPVKIDLDFLAILQAAMAERGLPYVVAGTVRNTQAAPFPGISLVDYDVTLVNPERVTVEGNAFAQQFAYNIGAVAPGVDIRRGYIVLSTRIDGRPVLVVNTHLESGSDPQIVQLRAAQAMELAQVIGAAPAVLLMGDLNDTPGSPMYQVLAGAGLVDVWTVLGRHSGLTCCHAADLSNPRTRFTQRIDYVWARGLQRHNDRMKGRAVTVGAERAEKFAGPLYAIWPSDHAGVMVTIEAPR
jgi:endonuclease/exonuclease/phosphatase family metal-dependent hydrolase